MLLHTTTYKILLHERKVLGYKKLPCVFTGNMELIALSFEIPKFCQRMVKGSAIFRCLGKSSCLI